MPQTSLPRHRIETGGRFVEEQHARRDDQRRRDVEPAPHAAGIILHLLRRRLRQIEGRQQIVGPALRGTRRGSPRGGRAARGSRVRSDPRRARRTGRSWRSRRAPRAAPAARSWPMTVAEPASGRSSVASIRIRVVLPAPFGPRMAKIMPRGTSRSIPSTARTSPKVLTRPRAEMADGTNAAEADRLPSSAAGAFPASSVCMIASMSIASANAATAISRTTCADMPPN